MVLAADGNVLAMADYTFISPPYDRVLDNDQLLANLAEYLTTSDRRWDLEDFPGMLADEIDVIVTSPEVLGIGTQLVSLFAGGTSTVQLRNLERPAIDTIFVGPYRDLERVTHHLDAGDVTVTSSQIRTAFAPPLPRDATPLVLLDSRGGRNVVVVLAESESQLGPIVTLLGSGAFKTELVSPNLGLYDLG
jgi:hypothetical protein